MAHIFLIALYLRRHIRSKSDWQPKSSGRSIRERDVAISEALAEYLIEQRYSDVPEERKRNAVELLDFGFQANEIK